MNGEVTERQPTVRISRLCVEESMTGRGKQRCAETRRWTVYGVDADGVEQVYAEHTTEEEHRAWQASDPLWREAQGALISRLLQNPATRDVVLQINIKAALDAGDIKSAATLAQHLSPATLRRLTGKDHDLAEG